MTATIVDKAVQFEALMAEQTERRKKRMSKPGKLRLPPLLEERRLSYLLTDGYFRIQAAFDRCYVAQLAREEGETYGGGKIIMTAQRKERDTAEAPRGILISAGAKALDALRSNGIDLGHIVTFAHYVVATMVVDTIDGHDVRVSVMNAGHISGSEDTRRLMLEGKLRMEYDEETGQHFYVKGKARKGAKPIMPWMTEDI